MAEELRLRAVRSKCIREPGKFAHNSFSSNGEDDIFVWSSIGSEANRDRL